MNDPIQQLVQLTGVGLAGLTTYLFFKFASNHVKHNSDTLEKLNLTNEKLIEWLKEHQSKH